MTKIFKRISEKTTEGRHNIHQYNEKGLKIYGKYTTEKSSIEEFWEYDDRNNVIKFKSITNDEPEASYYTEHKYDENNNEIYVLRNFHSSKFEIWREFVDNNNVYEKKKSANEFTEIWREYHPICKKMTYMKKCQNFMGCDTIEEVCFEYDDHGNILYEKCGNGKEIWYEYQAFEE